MFNWRFWKREPRPKHRVCQACGGQIFHAVDQAGSIVPLDSEPEIRYLVPDEQLTRRPGPRPHAIEARTYTGHIGTCARRKEKKRLKQEDV